jgi:hypothetical protein
LPPRALSVDDADIPLIVGARVQRAE